MSYLSFTAWNACCAPRPLRESREGVVSHLTHLEDLILTKYADGAEEAVETLEGLAEFFKGHAKKSVNLTVKIDGAPAIIAGIDPEDGKFFIGTKGALAKTPKIAKSPADLTTLYGKSAGLLDVMTTAFDALKGMRFPHILQGDVLFTPAIKQPQTIDGVPHITFKPNTIIYGIPSDSAFGRKVIAADFGVCFHTTYTGNSLSTMRAQSGADVDALTPPANVVLVSSKYQDLSGTLTFTATEQSTLTNLIAQIRTRTSKLASNPFLRALEATSLLRSELMVFQNALVREGSSITLSPKVFVKRWMAHLAAREAAMADTRKSTAGKEAVQNKFTHLRTLTTDTESGLVDVLAWQNAVIDAKTFLIKKLNAPGNLSTFYNSDAGLVAGQHEGFVAADSNGKFVKLVDRSEFSRLNLTAGRFRK